MTISVQKIQGGATADELALSILKPLNGTLPKPELKQVVEKIKNLSRALQD
jgi:hypothetical protein